MSSAGREASRRVPVGESAPARGDLSDDGASFYDGEGWGWQLLWLTRDEVLGVGQEIFGLAPTGAEFLASGMLNQSWHLRCPDHDRVIRVSRSERTMEQLRYEYDIATAWAEELPAVVVAEQPPGHSIHGHLLTIFPYLMGTPGTGVDPQLRMSELAPLMATMHRSALALDRPQRPGYRSIDDRRSAADGSTGRWCMEQKWADARRAVLARYGAGPEVTEVVTFVDQAVDELAHDLSRWTRSGRLRIRAAVHGDLNPRNQLYRDNRLIGVIDADECRVEPLIAEVAGLAYGDPAVDPADAWQAYQSAGGPLPVDDEDMLLSFARLGTLSEIEWITDDHGAATHLALGNLTNIAADLGRPVRG